MDIDADQDDTRHISAALQVMTNGALSIYLRFLAWMAGGAAVFGLVFALVIEPACLGLSFDEVRTTGSEWWLSSLCGSHIGHFAIAYFVYGLAVVGLLQISEKKHETRVVHRAYVTVLPNGVAPFRSGNGMLSCDVVFHNGGNLPATKVRWFIDRRFSTDSRLNDFPIGNDLSGNNIIAAKTEMIKGVKAIQSAELDCFREGGGPKDRWLYVWGRIAYEDGFGRNCRTDFCFRYNLAGARDGNIAAEAARQHEYGNRIDED